MGALTSVYAGGIALLALFSAPITVSDAFASFSKDISALSQAKNLTEETYYGTADKYAGQIDYTTVTIDEGISIAGHPFGETAAGYAGLVKNSSGLKVSNDDAGFKVAIYKAMVAVIESRDGKSMSNGDINKAVGAVLNHSKAAASMATPDGVRIAQVVSGAAGRNALDGKNFAAFADMVKGGVAPSSGAMVYGTWQDWVDANPGHKDTDMLWEKFHSGAAATLAAAQGVEKPDARTVSGLKRLVSGMESPAGRGKLVGFQAPEITFKWDSGGKTKLSDYKGSVVVVDFWATWCGPCIASMPHIRELVAHYKGQKVVVLGVTSIQDGFWPMGKPKIDFKGKPDEEIAMYPEYIKANDITWNIAVGDQNVFNPDYGVNGIPHMAIIDATGKIRYRGLHPSGVTLEQKIKMIDPLLKEIK